MISMQIKNLKQKNGQKGFTLMEVMIALSIFAVGILGVFSMQISAINSNANARRVTEDATLAMDKVEELLALPYTNNGDLAGATAPNWQEHSIANGDFTVATDGVDNDLDGQIDEGNEVDQVTIAWNVQNVSGDTICGVVMPERKSIRITVTHRRTWSRNRVLSLDFIKANI